MALTPLEQQIQDLAREALAAHNLVMVSARLAGGARALTLEVLAENPDGTGASIDNCILASRTLAAQLDVADILNTRYILEVGSPGMDRPLFTTADYHRFTGKQAKFSLNRKVAVADDTTSTVIGKITSANEKTVTLALGQYWPQPLVLNLADIRTAHLHPSPEEVDAVMVAANLRRSAEERAENPDRPRYDRPAKKADDKWKAPAPREKEVREKAHRPRLERDAKPNFKRGDFILNERERADLGVMTDEEKSIAKSERKQAYRDEQAGSEKRFFAKRAWGDRKSGGERRNENTGERRPGDRRTEKSFGYKKPTGDKKFGPRKPYGERSEGRSEGNDRGERKTFGERKSFGAKKAYGEKKFGEKKFGDKKFGDKKPYGKSTGKPADKSGGFGGKKFGAAKPGGPRKTFNKSK